MSDFWILAILLFVILAIIAIICFTFYKVETSCRHEYKVIDKTDLYWDTDVVGTVYTLQCTKCGKIKSKKIN